MCQTKWNIFFPLRENNNRKDTRRTSPGAPITLIMFCRCASKGAPVLFLVVEPQNALNIGLLCSIGITGMFCWKPHCTKGYFLLSKHIKIVQYFLWVAACSDQDADSNAMLGSMPVSELNESAPSSQRVMEQCWSQVTMLLRQAKFSSPS